MRAILSVVFIFAWIYEYLARRAPVWPRGFDKTEKKRNILNDIIPTRNCYKRARYITVKPPGFTPFKSATWRRRRRFTCRVNAYDNKMLLWTMQIRLDSVPWITAINLSRTEFRSSVRARKYHEYSGYLSDVMDLFFFFYVSNENHEFIKLKLENRIKTYSTLVARSGRTVGRELRGMTIK